MPMYPTKTMIRAMLLLMPMVASCISTRSSTRDITSTAASAQEALLDALSVFGGERLRGQTSGPAAALAGLEEHENTEDPTERDLILVLLPILTRVADGDRPLGPADYRVVRDVMSRMASKHPGDFAIQYAMTTGMAAMETALQTINAADDADSESRAQTLVAKFPRQARAHAHLGRILETNGDVGSALESYAQCLQLDPSLITCRTHLKSLAEQYSRPRCVSIPANRFGLHSAYAVNATTAKHRQGLRPIKIEKHQLLMESKPILDGSAVDEAESIADSKIKGVIISLSPLATAKLAEATAKLVDREGYLAIVINGKVRQAPRVMSPLESGKITVGEIVLDKICTKKERRTLPAAVATFL